MKCILKMRRMNECANINQRDYENLNRFLKQMAITKSEVVVAILFYGNGKNQITVNKDLNKMVQLRLVKENNLVEVR